MMCDAKPRERMALPDRRGVSGLLAGRRRLFAQQ